MPSYLEGAVQRAENLPKVLNLKTPIVMMAPTFKQQQRLAQQAERPRACKLKAPRIKRAAFAAKRNKVIAPRVKIMDQRLPSFQQVISKLRVSVGSPHSWTISVQYSEALSQSLHYPCNPVKRAILYKSCGITS